MIRLANKNDIDFVEQCYKDLLLYEAEHGSVTNWVLDLYPTRKHAENALNEGSLYVIENDEGEICGSVILNCKQLEAYKKVNWISDAKDNEVFVIHTLCINPKNAKRGYGKSVVAFAENLAREMGCKVVRLDTYVENFPAASLYKKLGYKYCGKVNTLFQGVIDEELILFEKVL